MCIRDSLKTVLKYAFNTFFTTVWIYIRKMHMFFSTIGEVRSRQSSPDAASFVRVVWKSVLFLMGGKLCNGKTKGLAIQYIFHCFFENSSEICIQYIFHDCLNLHKENAHVFSTIGEVRSRQWGSVAASFVRVFLKKCIVFRNEKIATVKQRVWRSNTFFTTVLKTVVKYAFNIFFTTVWIYIRKMHMFFSTIGEVRSRQ